MIKRYIMRFMINLKSVKTFIVDNKVYFIIGIIIIVFNLESILGLKTLIQDDLHHYYKYSENPGLDFYTSKYDLTAPFIKWVSFNLMIWSPNLTRFLYTLLFMVPTSILLFYLYYKKLRLPEIVSFAAAVIPNILPYQVLIPSYINGSFIVFGMLFYVVSSLIGIKYLETYTGNATNTKTLIIYSIIYFLTTQLNPRMVFMLPPLVFLFLIINGPQRRKITLISLTLVLSIYRYYQTLSFPKQPTKIMDLGMEEILRRFEIYFKEMIPFSLGSSSIDIIISIIFWIVIFIGLLIFIFKKDLYKNYGIDSTKKGSFYIIVFLILYLFFNVYPYIAMTFYFTKRYFYVSGFAYSALLVIAIFSISSFFPKNHLKKISYLLFSLLIIIIGISRYKETSQYNNLQNKLFYALKPHLINKEFPKNSQLYIISDVGIGTLHGQWLRSSAFLKIILDREDIVGFIGTNNLHYNFENAFIKIDREYYKRKSMHGLSLARPTFLYYFSDSSNELKQYKYGLYMSALPFQEQATKNDIYWKVFEYDAQTGLKEVVERGIGLDSYLEFNDSLSIANGKPNEILWGNVYDLEAINNIDSSFISNNYSNFIIESDSITLDMILGSLTENMINNPVNFGDKFELVSFDTSSVNNKINVNLIFKALDDLELENIKITAFVLNTNKENISFTTYKLETLNNINRNNLLIGTICIQKSKFKNPKYLGLRITYNKNYNSYKIFSKAHTYYKNTRLLIELNHN